MSQAGGPNSAGSVNIDFTGNVAPVAASAKQAEQIVEQSAAKMQASTEAAASSVEKATQPVKPAIENNVAKPIENATEKVRGLGEGGIKSMSRFREAMSKLVIPAAVFASFYRLGNTIASVFESSASKLDKFYAKLDPTDVKAYTEGLQKELDRINGMIAGMQVGQDSVMPLTSWVHDLVTTGETLNSALEQRDALYQRLAVSLQALQAKEANEAKKKKTEAADKAAQEQADKDKQATERKLENEKRTADRLYDIYAGAFTQVADEQTRIAFETDRKIEEARELMAQSESETAKTIGEEAIAYLLDAEWKAYEELEDKKKKAIKERADEEKKALDRKVENERDAARRVRDFWREVAQEQIRGTEVQSFASANLGQSFDLIARQRENISGLSIDYGGD